MLKVRLMILIAAACVTGVCSATPNPGGGKTSTAKPACLLQIPFIQPFCFV